MPVRVEATRAAAATKRRYAADADRPPGAFGAPMATYGGAMGAVAGAARLAGRTVTLSDLLHFARVRAQHAAGE
ncbi:hypothetical protein PV392_00260 [Streptomyces sp. ME03-5709C]|nr:hypothetical protein [Streptomyces sp. ME03-5709C]